jgi:hypothetical protein
MKINSLTTLKKFAANKCKIKGERNKTLRINIARVVTEK